MGSGFGRNREIRQSVDHCQACGRGHGKNVFDVFYHLGFGWYDD